MIADLLAFASVCADLAFWFGLVPWAFCAAFIRWA